MLSALGLALLNCDPQKLDLSKKAVESLYPLFCGRSEGKILSCLEKAVNVLKQRGLLPKSTEPYLSETLQRFVPAITNAVKTNTLDKVFLVPAQPEREVKISFDYGEQMDNRKYQNLVEKILQADGSDEKISIIIDEVHSLADLSDILSDTELNDEDYELLTDKLPLPVFGVLLSKYPDKELLGRESEQLLYKALMKRKQRLSVEENRQVEQALGAIDNEVLF